MVSDYDSIQLEEIKHVRYFQPIVVDIVFICQTSPSNISLLWSEQLKRLLVCDHQSRSVCWHFSSATIYKVGKCVMASVLKIFSDFKRLNMNMSFIFNNYVNKHKSILYKNVSLIVS